jgi:hypothetical protein
MPLLLLQCSFIETAKLPEIATMVVLTLAPWSVLQYIGLFHFVGLRTQGTKVS